MKKIYYLMMQLAMVLLMAFFMGSLSAQAQSTVSGEVKDEAGAPLIGANVLLKGTNKGALTDVNGKFAIGNVVQGKYTIVVSFIGYKTISQEIEVNSSAVTVNITSVSDPLALDEVIVTGTFDQRTKLESSIAITTMSPSVIDQRLPRGTGDLLQAVPGVWVDNSAGEVGTKVVARGLIPVGNDQIGFQYVSLQEEGLPVMGSQIGFAVVDMFHRNDANTLRMEAIRGGSASIAVANAPGGIFNFISKTGGSKFGGSARLQGGMYANNNSLYRVDVDFGGPIKGNWSYHVGGFYRGDQGARTLPFNANEGGQFKANIANIGKKGSFKLYGKFLSDRNTFFKEIALNTDLKSGYQSGEGAAVDINSSSTFLDLNANIPDAQAFVRGASSNPTRNFNSRNGILNQTWAIGVEADRDLGNGWNIAAKARYSNFKQDYLQFQGNIVIPVVPTFLAPNSLGYAQFGAAALASAGTYVGAGVPAPLAAQLAGSFAPGVFSPSYFDANTGELLARVIFGAAGPQLDPSVPNKLGKYLLTTAPLNMYNNIQDFQGIASISKQAGKHSLNFGGYMANTRIQTKWFVDGVTGRLGPNSSPVRIQFTGPQTLPAAVAGIPPLAAAFGGLYGGRTFEATTREGMVLQSGLAYTVTDMTSNILAGFISDNWKVTDKLSIDAGLRYEIVKHSGTKEGWQGGTAIGGLGGVDGNPLTTSDLGSRIRNPASNFAFAFDYAYFSGSLGINYKISDKSATYARFSRGNKAPELDYYANNFVNIPVDQKGAIETVTQAEVGYKVNSKTVSLTATAFYSYLDNALLQLFISNGANSFFTDATFNASRTVGLEIENVLRPTDKFSIRTNLTVQNAVYARLTYQNVAGSVNKADFFDEDFSGNRVKDVAPVILDITPSYKIGKFTPYINYRWFSERQGNRRNSIQLASYGVLSAGVTGDLNARFSIAVQASNILNSAGINLFGGYGLQGTTGEDIAVGGVRNLKTNTVLPNTDITQLNTLGAPIFARPILPRLITVSVSYKF